MKILIADDDPVTCRRLEDSLQSWSFETSVVGDGQSAWQAVQASDGPRLLLIDWQMPEMDGLELCRKIRSTTALQGCYILIVTVRGRKQDIVEALQAGADDFLSKPFDLDELVSRLQVGKRVLSLQQALGRRVSELEDALANVKRLQQLLPLCGYCKKVRSDENYWQLVEEYLAERGDMMFSHGICPNCYEQVVRPEMERLKVDLPPYPRSEI